jgi:hypothetical protein
MWKVCNECIFSGDCILAIEGRELKTQPSQVSFADNNGAQDKTFLGAGSFNCMEHDLIDSRIHKDSISGGVPPAEPSQEPVETVPDDWIAAKGGGLPSPAALSAKRLIDAENSALTDQKVSNMHSNDPASVRSYVETNHLDAAGLKAKSAKQIAPVEEHYDASLQRGQQQDEEHIVWNRRNSERQIILPQEPRSEMQQPRYRDYEPRTVQVCHHNFFFFFFFLSNITSVHCFFYGLSYKAGPIM